MLWNIDFQSVRPAEFQSAESESSGQVFHWAHRPEAYFPVQ